MENTISNAGVVTVFYQPPDSALDVFIMLSEHGYFVVIYNNGINGTQLERLGAYPNIEIVGGGENIGLASGLNVALEHLWRVQDVDGALLLDQDSKPDALLAEKLRSSFTKLSVHAKVACVGPRILDIKKKGAGQSDSNLKILNTDGIATSGTYLGKDVFFEIGSFMDELFVDCIDHEWCFRARSGGYEIFVDTSCTMLHDMGELGINIFGAYKPAYTSPARHYFIIRNTVAMLKFNYVPLSWKVREVFKTIPRMGFYVIFSSDRKSSVKNIVRALRDGIKGSLGPINALRAE